MTLDALVALVRGRRMGIVSRSRQGELRFTYDETWRQSAHAFPLSLSMPLAAAEHKHEAITAFLWGLLPDNELVLERWAKRFQVSARNPFALIANVGEDCAGAVQFVRPERLNDLLTERTSRIEWLDERGVAERLRALREDHSAWRIRRDEGQFSLAGAQPKTALFYRDGKWGVPAGQTPTTHILKPPITGLDGHAENEHVCLMLARALGLDAVASQVVRFEDQTAIVVERYDRLDVAKEADAAEAAAKQALRSIAKTEPIWRIHQEDICQAFGLPPSRKYQNDGGPNAAQITDLLRTHSSRPVEDVMCFVDALALNWLISGTDAHAKNYALLHRSGGQVFLAPLFDLASSLPYKEFDQGRVKLAMKVGGEYRVHNVGARHWRKLARELRIGDEEQALERVRQLASRTPEQVAKVCQQAKREGLTHPIVDGLAKSLTSRARECAVALA